MIDTAKFYFLMTDKVRRKLEQEYNSNPAVKFYPNRIYLQHPFHLRRLPVHFNRKTSTLCAELSLPKLFQGHNVFGSNDIHGLCLKAIEFIYKGLGIQLTEAETQCIEESGIRLGRLDTTCMFLLQSRHMTPDVLEQIWHHFAAEGKKWAVYGIDRFESVYNQINSTRVSDKFYDKYAEIQRSGAHSIPLNVIARPKVITFAKRALRFETTWRAKELVDLGLDYTDDWTPTLVKEQIAKRLKSFQFSGAIRPKLEKRELEGLNDTAQMFYELWEDGAQLRRHRRCRTLRRTREFLLAEHDVDIYRPTQASDSQSLKDLLHPDQAYYFAPRSIVREGAIFIP